MKKNYLKWTLSSLLIIGTKLSHDRVKQIVTARVPGSNVSEIKDFRGEGDSFKGKLIHAGVTYDFEIDAYTGRTIKWSSNK